MTTYINLGKAPESPEERESLLAQKIHSEEHMTDLQLTQVQRRVVEFLLSGKGYREGDLEINRDFSVQLPECVFTVRADIIVKIGDKRLFTIKCVMSSMESWERHAVAFGRVADRYQIPYAIITDSEHARILATSDGSIAAEGLEAIPSRQEAGSKYGGITLSAYAPEKSEKEKRILYAFDAIKCQSPGETP